MPNALTALLIAASWWLAILPGTAAAEEAARPAAEASRAAAERFKATLRSTLSFAPGLDAELLRVEAAEAEALARSGAGVPYLQWETEGIGGSFNREPNAQDSLRVGMPFKMPWHSSDTRALERAAEDRKVFTGRASELQAMAVSGALWLEIAALDERLLVVRNRLALFDRLLILQKKRLELGEIAGTEVMQLALARAGEMAREAGLVAERQSRRELLTTSCGPGCETALAGDLEALVAATSEAGPPTTDQPIDSLPLARAAASEQDLAAALAEITSRSTWGYPAMQVEWERFPTLDTADSYNALGLQLTVPLHFGRSGNRQVAKAQAEALAAASDRRARDLELDQRRKASRHRRSAAQTQLAVLEPLLKLHDRHEHSLTEQFRLGAISYLAFLDGVARLDSVRVAAVDAREDLLRARLELAALVDDPALIPPSLSISPATPSEATP